MTDHLVTDRLAVSVDEAVRLTGWSRTHLYRAIKAGRLPTVTLGNSRRILMDDLRAFLAKLRDDEVANKAEAAR